MIAQKVSLDFLARVVALAAAFAIPISYGIFVQVDQVFANQRSIRVEIRGNACLLNAYAILHDVLVIPYPSDAMKRRKDVVRFDAARCTPTLRDWPGLRSQLSRSGLSERERRHVAAASVSDINTLASNSNLLYDAQPVVLNLASAVSYDLPKAQALIVASATTNDIVGSARYEATADQQLRSARYDIVTAIAYGPEVASILAQPMQRGLFLGEAYDKQLEAWQKPGTSRAALRRTVLVAVRKAVDQGDVIYGLLQRSIASKLADEATANVSRLRVLWFAYAIALILSLAASAIIASLVTRRERRVLAQLHQERSYRIAESERDRARSELAAREARFQAIFAESPLPIAISDLHANVVECNEAYLHLVGCSVAAGSPRALLDSLSTEPRDAVERIYGSADDSNVTRELEFLLIRRNQERVWCHAFVSPVASADGPPKYCSVILQNISERVEREQRLRHTANHDYLTGLPNRAAVVAALAKQLERNSEHARFALLFIDVDDFKTINDTLGHAAGDDSLKNVATRLSTLVRETDMVARYGGDEFVVLLVHPLSVANAREIAERIGRACVSPFPVLEAAIAISLSIGVVLDRAVYTSAEQVLLDGDAAMYEIKLSGTKRLVSIRSKSNSASA